MKANNLLPHRKHAISYAMATALGMLTVMPAFAETEVEALKRELAEQKQLIQTILLNQESQKKVNAKVEGQEVAPASATGSAAFTFYGIADVNVTSMDSGFGSKVSVGSGGLAASRVGFKGERNLGDGMKGVFQVEAGVLLDTGAVGNGAVVPGINNTSPSSGAATGTGSQVFSRQAYAGLKGTMGTLTFGRQYAGSYIAAAVTANAMGTGFYGYSGAVTPLVGGMPTRANNSLVYLTPNLGGFSAHLTLTTGAENNLPANTAVGATTTNDKAGRGADLALFYTNGPLSGALTTWSVYNGSFVTAGETDLAKKTGWQIAGNYNLGMVKLFGTYVKGKISGGNYENVTKTLSDASAWSLSASAPFGKSTAYLSYTRLNDKSSLDRDAKLIGVGYAYKFLPETTFYASWGRMDNGDNSTYSLADGGNLVGNVTKPGFAPSGLMVGISQQF